MEGWIGSRDDMVYLDDELSSSPRPVMCSQKRIHTTTTAFGRIRFCHTNLRTQCQIYSMRISELHSCIADSTPNVAF